MTKPKGKASTPAESIAPDPDVDDIQPLPGMEEVTGRAVTALEAAVRRTVASLQELGYLEEMHAAHTAAAIELAQVISMKHTSGKASTIGNDMRAMIDLLDRLVPERDDSVDLELKATMEQWSKVVAEQQKGQAPA